MLFPRYKMFMFVSSLYLKDHSDLAKAKHLYLQGIKKHKEGFYFKNTSKDIIFQINKDKL